MNAELETLCEAAVEGRLTPEQRRRLERIALESPEARRYYVERLHLNACLHWSLAGEKPDVPAGVKPFPRWRVGLVSLAAALLLAVGAWWLLTPSGAVATLVSGKSCRWDGGTLPTETGARLGVGRLRLAEGLARLKFDGGAEVTLEAPAELELISSSKCVLHGGRLVAKVPPAAIGFLVLTPTTEMKDLGTEFGVHVRDERTTDVQVFDGRVDVTHKRSGRLEAMTTGAAMRFGADTVREFDPHAEPPLAPSASPSGEGSRIVQLSTLAGRGKDVYVQPRFPSENMSDVLLLVKNTASDKSDFNRKAYMGFDLAGIAGQRVIEARLTLTFVPTGMGFASEVPDSTFALYGLTDESLDGWEEGSLRWANAPANRPGGDALDADRVTLLGRFEIAQGAQAGTRTVSGPALAEFLERDANGLTTLILVRETKGSGRTDLVHGFAGRRHPSLPPPTLTLTVAPR